MTSASQKPNWTVYIIETQTGKLYTGITTNVTRRFEEHRRSKRGAKFFNAEHPGKIVFQEAHPDRSSASRREMEIKKWPRKKKLDLIEK